VGNLQREGKLEKVQWIASGGRTESKRESKLEGESISKRLEV